MRNVILNVYAGLFVYFECLLAATVIRALKAGRHEPAYDKDYVVILGCRIRPDGTLYPLIRGRVERAISFVDAQYMATGKRAILVPSGGKGNDEPLSEGEAMARWFIAHGVPEDRVFIDATSTTTVENMNNARAIMEAQGFSKAAVCTNNYHLRRALWVARDAGLDATGIAAPSTRNPISFVRGRLRETCSWILYFVRRVIRVG